jgi:hypothetical protein
MSHFKHNPDKRGTLASEPGSYLSTDQDQQASLWANTKRPPRPARGCKKRSNGCPPGYSYIDDYEDDDEELVFFKQEHSSETMETAQTKPTSAGSAYYLRTHVTDRHPGFNAGGFYESGGPPRKRPAPDNYYTANCAQKTALQVCSIFTLNLSTPVSLTQKSCHRYLSILRLQSLIGSHLLLPVVHQISSRHVTRTVH